MIIDHTRHQLLLNDIDPLEINEFKVQKRDGREVGFEAHRILLAIEKAFQADRGVSPDKPLDAYRQEECHKLTKAVIKQVLARAVRGEQLEIELIQDAVESQLMGHGHYTVARRYIVYREERKRARALRGQTVTLNRKPLNVRLSDGSSEPLDPQKIRRTLVRACDGLERSCTWQEVADEVMGVLYNGITRKDIEQALLTAVLRHAESEPAYGYVAARLLLKRLYREVWQKEVAAYEFDITYRRGFKQYITRGVKQHLLNPELLQFDLDKMASGLAMERDTNFNYSGLKSLYDHYLLRRENRRIETPQYFFMRVAMELALTEGDLKNEWAVDFYEQLSGFRFMPATPILMHAGVVDREDAGRNAGVSRNTDDEKSILCNRGAINISAHLKEGGLDERKLQRTVRTAMRMLDNAIDIYTYPSAEVRRANLKNRPVGLGLMGLKQAVISTGLSGDCDKAVDFADQCRDTLSYYATLASSELARERGVYESYHDAERRRRPSSAEGPELRRGTRNWAPARESVQAYGMRNCSCAGMAAAENLSCICGIDPYTAPTGAATPREITLEEPSVKKKCQTTGPAACRSDG